MLTEDGCASLKFLNFDSCSEGATLSVAVGKIDKLKL